MIGKRSIFVHAGLVVASAILALGVWTRDKQAKAVVQGDVKVWGGSPSDVQSIAYDGKKKRFELTSKKDAEGRYFTGSVEKDKAPPPHPADPDSGAPDEPAAGEKTVIGVVSITPTEKLLDLLAPLRAIRAVGQVAPDREAEFGLNEPEGTLTLKMKDAERKLVIGGPTFGGGDRYARDPATGEVYVVKADIFRNVDTPETSLLERDLHEWKDTDVASAKVIAKGKSRTMIHGGAEGKRFWADEGDRNTADETLGNWVSKVDRLHPTDYPQPTPEPRETVVRIEYTGSGKSLGYLEVIRGPADDSGKPQYFLLTERTRIPGKVIGSAAEQVEQDVETIVK